MTRDAYPPEYDYPEPTCAVCETTDVTRESMEDGAPLCEEHDHPIRRQRVRLETRVRDAGERRARISQEMMGASAGAAERLRSTMKSARKTERRAQGKLETIQAECEHPDAVSVEVYTEEQLSMVPEGEMPDELPEYVYTVDCDLCGLVDQYSPGYGSDNS